MKNSASVTAPLDVVVGAVHASDAELGSPAADDPDTPAYTSRDEIEVEWRGRWWPATIMERRGSGRFMVHYTGYGDEWDEVVGVERIRLRVVPETPTVNDPALVDSDP
ncbi:MAG: hypothetical protein KIT84_31055 [Labilithrix sp.]|nr:hypothetical protein [Labilithrix sp.]MCW5815508.1 hypothetical protein [Labilithrix sp.]